MAEEINGSSLDSDEWEVVNDDGFVYKRRKRNHHIDPPPLPPPRTSSNINDDQYLKQRRLLKKAKLLNLKSKYEEEIREWESMSQMLQRTTPTDTHRDPPSPSSTSAAASQTQTPNRYKQVLKELLHQAEVQEALIENATSLCCAAELLSKEHEHDLKQATVNLPVWASPREILHNICPSNSDEKA
eukprot:Gb_06141 [translate_table: standard]